MAGSPVASLAAVSARLGHRCMRGLLAVLVVAGAFGIVAGGEVQPVLAQTTTTTTELPTSTTTADTAAIVDATDEVRDRVELGLGLLVFLLAVLVVVAWSRS